MNARDINEKIKNFDDSFELYKLIDLEYKIVFVIFPKRSEIDNYQERKNKIIFLLSDLFSDKKIDVISKRKYESLEKYQYLEYINIFNKDVKAVIIDKKNYSTILLTKQKISDEDKNFIIKKMDEKFSTSFLVKSFIFENYNKDKEVSNIYFLTFKEAEIISLYKKIMSKSDFLSFNRKKIQTEFGPSNRINDFKFKRFITFKKIEFILNSIAAVISQNDLFSKYNFEFVYKKIYFSEKILDQYLLPIMYSKFSKLNLGKLLNEEETEFIYWIVNRDPINISKVFFQRNIDRDLIENGNSTVSKRELKNYLDFEYFNNLEYGESNPERMIIYNRFIEKALEKNFIYDREIDSILCMPALKYKFDQNIFTFIEKHAMKKFIDETIFFEKGFIAIVLRITDGIMRYINSEYKIMLKPYIYNLEEMIINFTNKLIIDLLEIKRENDSISLNESIKFKVKEDKISNIPFIEYLDIVISLIQKNGSKNFTNYISGQSYSISNPKENWEELKYFFDSEKLFNKELTNVNKHLPNDIKIEKYSMSKIFKFNLNYLISKNSFGSLINFMQSLEFEGKNDSFDEFKNFDPGFDKLKMLNDLRNSISHQDTLLNKMENNLIDYEKILNEYLKFMMNFDRKNSLKSYQFQIDMESLNFEESFKSKIWGLFNYYKNNSSKTINKLLMIIKPFLSNLYFSIFGTDIFSEIDSIKREEKSIIEKSIFEKLKNIEIDLNYFEIEENEIDNISLSKYYEFNEVNSAISEDDRYQYELLSEEEIDDLKNKEYFEDEDTDI